jgi:hypothetical protein
VVETLVPITDDWRPAEAAVTPLARTDRPTVWVFAAILAAHLAVFLYVVAAGFVRQPYSDMYDFLRAEFDFERGGDLFGYLASPHNHQHLVWVRILTALDVQVFHGAAVIFPLTASLSIVVAAAAVAVQLWRRTPVRAAGALASMLSALLIVSTVNAVDCTQPINCVYAIAFGFAVLAVVAFEQAESSRHAVLLVSLALAAAFCAVAGSAAGVAVFPVLMIGAIRAPGARGLIVPTLLASLVAISIVLTALLGAGAGQSGGDPSGGGVVHAWKMVQYFLVYAGMPWSAIGLLSRIRLAIGLATIAIGAALLWRGSRRVGAAGRLERIGLDLVLFSLLTAAMAALGRVDENEAVVVPVRYAVFMSAFQVGVICVLAPSVGEHWASVRRYAVPAALAAAAGLLVQQAAGGASVLRTSSYIRSEIAAFEAGARRPEMRQLIHPDFNVAMRVQAESRRRGLYQ